MRATGYADGRWVGGGHILKAAARAEAAANFVRRQSFKNALIAEMFACSPVCSRQRANTISPGAKWCASPAGVRIRDDTHKRPSLAFVRPSVPDAGRTTGHPWPLFARLFQTPGELPAIPGLCSAVCSRRRRNYRPSLAITRCNASFQPAISASLDFSSPPG